ncbi:metallophosphoesterase [Alteriqipengyuania sp. WL0013]|uniref:metallophosphoesterase family protein n=1 Tax=Alteriqipengyuania sp. WL0013 TaxID=3110773 RepID=UPI002C2B3BA7|nr:metallophosphoesterase [Alteriqipengyuania sp. WL0013]MEB3416360.1 metallophosphoesterase [Alteriqipengyuania sp. WL0013]
MTDGNGTEGRDNALLFHFSDIHFGLEDNEALDWAKDEIARQCPDAVAITGDLTMRARHREFAAARDWILSLKAPVTVEVGNHDMPYFNPIERFFAPYSRFKGMEQLVEREIDLPGIAVVPLKTAVRAQPRLNWSKGWVTGRALKKCLDAIDALPPGTSALVTVHHPLREVGTEGTALTKNGERALAELAKRNVLAVLSGHVHDAFDLVEPTPNGPVRMIGAGTLSKRTRSTPPSFNELRWDGQQLTVSVRNLEHVSSRDMMIDDVPEDALPPREPGEPVAPVGRIPRTDPPVH